MLINIKLHTNYVYDFLSIVRLMNQKELRQTESSGDEPM